MVGNLALMNVGRPRWRAAVNLQLEPQAWVVGVMWQNATERVPIAFAPDPRLAPPAVTVRKFDLWLRVLPMVGVHLTVWRIG